MNGRCEDGVGSAARGCGEQGMTLLTMIVTVFLAMMTPSSFEIGAVVPIQAGVSVLLVLTLGPQTAGYVRMN